jgi:hypothetical protein
MAENHLCWTLYNAQVELKLNATCGVRLCSVRLLLLGELTLTQGYKFGNIIQLHVTLRVGRL